MKIKSFQCVLVFLFALLITQPASAHGDEPRIEISADRLNPGSVLDIRGVDFEFEEAVTLSMVSAPNEISFGTVLADVEGIFQLTITLPVDLSEGTYVIRATTDDHVVESPQISVSGAAMIEGGGEGLRDDDDGLLAPMPTTAPNVSSTPVSQAAPPVESAPAQNSFTPMIWIGAGIGVILVLGMLRRMMR